jgi:hypothetical protein
MSTKDKDTVRCSDISIAGRQVKGDWCDSPRATYEEWLHNCFDYLTDDEARVGQKLIEQFWVIDDCAVCVNRRYGFTRGDCLFIGKRCPQSQQEERGGA